VTRTKPPNDREGWISKIKLGSSTVYLIMNFTEPGRDEGQLIELLAKADEGNQGTADALSLTASLLLQYNCPPEKLVEKWRGMRFPPDSIGRGTSIPDAFARTIQKTLENRKEQK